MKQYIQQPDKLQHFIAGLLLALTGAVFDPWWGLAAGMIYAMGKEARDHTTGKGTPDIVDFYATALGAVVGFGYGWVI